MKRTKFLFMILIAFVLLFLATSCSCSRDDDTKLKQSSIPPDDPANVVAEIFQSMADGLIDHSKIIYGDKQKPLKPIHTYKKNFHNVKFQIRKIQLSKYDDTTQTVQYSCEVPHPAVAFWQWYPREPSELKYVPKGIHMEGRFTLAQDNEIGWRVKVDNNTNPICLYNKVASSANRMWYMMNTTQPSSQSINFNVLMLIASYSTALDIAEKNSKKFAEDIIKEFSKVVPK